MVVTHAFLVFFFFQAEDGIRDTSVTGVQTCALPISDGCLGLGPRLALPDDQALALFLGPPAFRDVHVRACHAVGFAGGIAERSEERRVGKEGRGRGSQWQWKRQRMNSRQMSGVSNEI